MRMTGCPTWRRWTACSPAADAGPAMVDREGLPWSAYARSPERGGPWHAPANRCHALQGQGRAKLGSAPHGSGCGGRMSGGGRGREPPASGEPAADGPPMRIGSAYFRYPVPASTRIPARPPRRRPYSRRLFATGGYGLWPRTVSVAVAQSPRKRGRAPIALINTSCATSCASFRVPSIRSTSIAACGLWIQTQGTAPRLLPSIRLTLSHFRLLRCGIPGPPGPQALPCSGSSSARNCCPT